ncbi:hypothetical protein ACFVMC_08755 [Nocardia sp. NPDC127579]|uniref:hypothetical protein n=1 Tax=Nocardia sp. NPDC127579 TaxID=3345402 RepID=UPI0036255BB8
MITGDVLCEEDQDIRRLRVICDLPVDIDAAGRFVITVDQSIRGVTTPRDLGEEIREVLKARGELGPVMWHRSQRYTFLTRRSPDAEASIFYRRALRRTGSALIPLGGVLALPSLNVGARDTQIRKWIHPPRNRFRPDTATVLAAITECELGVPRL